MAFTRAANDVAHESQMLEVLYTVVLTVAKAGETAWIIVELSRLIARGEHVVLDELLWTKDRILALIEEMVV